VPAEQFHELLAAHARTRGDALALAFGQERWSYAQTDAAVGDYAGGLSASGIGRGDVVAVHGFSRPECLALFLACCRAGATFLGLSPKYTARELEYVIADAGPSLVVVMDETSLDGLDPRPPIVTAAALRRRGEAPAPQGGPDDPCAIVYTSGSTGAPKGALLSQRQIIRSALLTVEHWYGGGDGLRTVAQHPINHVGWLVCECATTLVAGGAIFFRERFDGGATLRLIAEERLTVWIAFPSMLALAMQSPEYEACDLSSLRRLAFGSMPSIELIGRLRERTSAVFSVSYGLTEAGGGAVTATDAGAGAATVANTIGRPVPGLEFRIADPDGQVVAPGEAGELLIRDECVFLGYLNRPDATAAALDGDDWLHTGDMVAEGRDGNLRMVGRLKEMFKSGGYNVYPTEVETVICTHDAVSAVAVVEVPDPLWTEVGVAFVVPTAGDTPSVDELREHARERLANYKVPKRFVIVGELPQLPNGKPDKVLLRRLARQQGDAYESIA
jgi:acyl-CoA synthetase (AMP-forming)/AMP-acid ligase II